MKNEKKFFKQLCHKNKKGKKTLKYQMKRKKFTLHAKTSSALTVTKKREVKNQSSNSSNVEKFVKQFNIQCIPTLFTCNIFFQIYSC